MVKGEKKLKFKAVGNWFDTEDVITLGETVKVSDPCYSDMVWCTAKLSNVLPGEYKCSYAESDEGSWGLRISAIRVVHKDYQGTVPNILLSTADIGVDSGQAGIYDYAYYMRYRTPESKNQEWYERVCDITCGEKPNPNYIPFEQSKSYKPEYDVLNDIPLKPANHEERVALRVEMERAKIMYGNTREGCEKVWYNAANAIDGKGYVSSSGYGDGSYALAIARNKEKKIVAIELIYLSDDEE